MYFNKINNTYPIQKSIFFSYALKNKTSEMSFIYNFIYLSVYKKHRIYEISFTLPPPKKKLYQRKIFIALTSHNRAAGLLRGKMCIVRKYVTLNVLTWLSTATTVYNFCHK
jgi:hypothetical protein